MLSVDADRVDLDRVVSEKLSFFTREEDLLTVGRVRRSELVRAVVGDLEITRSVGVDGVDL
jgi:hypothetical protein